MEDWVKILISASVGFAASTILEPVKLGLSHFWERRATRRVLYRELGSHLNTARAILKYNETAKRLKDVIPAGCLDPMPDLIVKLTNVGAQDSHQVFDYYVCKNQAALYALSEWRTIHGSFMHVRGMFAEKEYSALVEHARVFMKFLEVAAQLDKRFDLKGIERAAKYQERFAPPAMTSFDEVEKFLKLVPPLRHEQ